MRAKLYQGRAFLSTISTDERDKMSYRDMTAPQMRAARGLLDWSQTKLAEMADVALSTVKRMESAGPERSSIENLDKVSTALQDAGVEFINGDAPGVRLRPLAK
jgi:transcriptional regulator with XRE-family HTH domain